jgi:hypothetical protein
MVRTKLVWLAALAALALPTVALGDGNGNGNGSGSGSGSGGDKGSSPPPKSQGQPPKQKNKGGGNGDANGDPNAKPKHRPKSEAPKPKPKPEPQPQPEPTPKVHHRPRHNGAGRNLVFKGTLADVNAAAGTATVSVSGGNRAAQAYRGQTVSFTISGATIRAADRDGDGRRDEATDLNAGDRVVVKVRLANGAQPTQPFAAQQVIDQA